MFDKTDSLTALFISHAGGYRTDRALRERRDEILTAIEKREVEPSRDLLEELAEINVKLGDAE